MAYEALKSLIRQYIKPNEQEEITGAILQGILLEMVNQLGVAGNYLPLTGGNITGNVTVSSDPTATTHNAVRLAQSGVTIENIASVGLNEVLALSANSITYQSYFPNATPSTMTVSFGMTGITLTGGITASSFVNSSVEQSQRGNYLLKADGNVVSISDIGGGVDMSVVWESLADDTNEQIASSHLTDALSTYATITQLGDYLPLDGGTLTGAVNFTNTYGNGSIFVDSVDYDLTITASNMIYLDAVRGVGVNGNVTATSFIKSNGTSSEFLKADGSVDSNAYITASALSGYATQSWVTTQLGDYLPLDGGTLTGAVNFTNTYGNGSIFVDSVDYDLTITASNMIYLDAVRGVGVNGNVTATSFIKSGGTSAQFLKADGSVDSNTYVTASALTGYATQSWVTNQLGDYLPLDGGTLTGAVNFTNTYGNGSIFVDSVDYDLTITASNMIYLDAVRGVGVNGNVTATSFIKSGGTSAQFLKADGSVDSTAYLPKQGSSFYFITDADMPETAADISTLNAAHRMTLYRNAILMPYQMDNANDGGFIRSRGTSESSAIMEIGMWDDSGAGETIQFNYYPTTSTINPTYSISVPKKSGTIALTSDLASYNPTTNFKTINNQSIIGTGNINIEGGGTLYDAEVEYLENSSASQLIDTNYIPQGNGVEIGGSFYYMGYYTSNQWETLVYTAYVNEITNTFRIIRNQSTNNSILLYNNTIAGGGGTTVNVSLNTKYDFVLNDNGYTFNGVQYARSSSQGAVNTDSLKISSGGHIRLYSFYIKKDGALVRDFIPVRVGNVGYLYDKVSGELFGNSGTGSFVLGQDTGPGGGLPYLPLTGGTITGNLTVNGAVKFNRSLTFAYDTGIYFGTDNGIRIKRDNSRLLIINESSDDIIIGDYDDTNYTSFVNDLQGGTTTSSYTSVTQEWFILRDGTAQFKTVSQTSDLRKKTIMGDVPMNIYNVANAPLFKFTWNDEKKYSGQHIGSAAQYWQTVLPELVSIGRDADMTLAMQYDVIALASAITVAKTVVNHEERIILLERENEALKKEIADLKSA